MEDINIELCNILEIKTGIDCNKCIGCDDFAGVCTPLYPNLFKANNFVQIMKIFHQEVNFSTGLSDNPVQSFLNVYLSVIQNNKDKDMIERIKHYAQLVEWEY